MRHAAMSFAQRAPSFVSFLKGTAFCGLSALVSAGFVPLRTSAFADGRSEARTDRLLRDVLGSNGEWIGSGQEKCWPHAWKGGDPTRFAVAVDSELCLRGKFGEAVPASEMRTEISARSVGNATILESDLNLFAAEAFAFVPVIGTPTAEADVIALGYEVWSDSIGAPELTFARNFTLLNFDKAVTAPFKIGPVPATVNAGARARLDVAVQGVLAIANARTDLTPKLGSGGYAQVAVDAIVAKAGVEGEIELLNDTVQLGGAVGLGVDTTQNPALVFFAGEAKGTNDLSALSGGIRLFVESVKGGKFFEREFFRREGVQRSDTLFAITLKPTPIFQARAELPDGV